MFVCQYQSYHRFCWRQKKTLLPHNLLVYPYTYHFNILNHFCFISAPIIGHVGDGNFHSLMMIDPTNEKELAAAKELAFRMSKYVLE